MLLEKTRPAKMVKMATSMELAKIQKQD